VLAKKLMSPSPARPSVEAELITTLESPTTLPPTYSANSPKVLLGIKPPFTEILTSPGSRLFQFSATPAGRWYYNRCLKSVKNNQTQITLINADI
jgi:hypothetical protein